ncbi:hypothetical protein LguiA_035466 [Lonicera macranthoides]
MGSCNWFKTLFRLRKIKEDKSKQVKGRSNNKKSNGSSKWSCITGKGSNGRDARVLHMPTAHIAATRIQTAFRAYMARKGLRRLKGTVRFQALIEAQSVENQSSVTLNYIHSWSKIQSEIRARRLCMVMNGRIKQKKVENQLKLEAKLHELEVDWCGGPETMEEILSRIQQREEAIVKRERAMAYAFSHQWRANTGHYFGQAYYDLGKESWGWSWMERWIAVCPWETRVHIRSIIPKKVPARQGSKVAKTKKTLVSVKSHLTNGKGRSTTKAAECPLLTADKTKLIS